MSIAGAHCWEKAEQAGIEVEQVGGPVVAKTIH